mgnify:CR=1 FL=1
MFSRFTNRWWPGISEKAYHPFLAGIFFVFFQLKEAFVLYDPLYVFLFVLTLGILPINPLFFIKIFIHNWIKAAILTTVSLLFFLFFDNIRYGVFQIIDLPYGYLKYIVFILFLFIAILIIKSKSTLNRLNAYLNILFILLICFEFGTGVIVKIQSKNWIDTINLGANIDSKKEFSNEIERPTIYHIVLDAYTSSSQLKKEWNYDNTELENYLSRKGFYTPKNAQSNSTATQMSMANCLNMNYFKNLDSIIGIDIVSTTAYRLAIKNGKVLNKLSSYGYEIINLSV